jgi:dienelactone hydrolase
MRPQRRYTARNAAILIAAFLLCSVIAWPFVRAHLEALAVLQAVSGQPVTGVLKTLATEPVTVHDETFQTEAGPVRARFYSPIKHPNAHGLVVFHGIHYRGIDEPRMIAFAQAMAASGLNVVTPELPDIKDYRISERSIQVIGASAKWFAQQRGAPVGVMGLSFSGGLALVAAADAQYAPSMRFVFAVGSQGSMTRVADYYGTGRALRPDGTTELLAAHEYGPLVLEYEHVEEFVPAADVEPIRAVLRAHLYEDKPAEDDATKLLTPPQSVEAKSLMNAASASTRTLLQLSSTKHTADMLALSPDAHLSSLTVPVFLLHGEADNIIPAAETLWMASQLKAETLRAALVSPMLSHLDMEKQPGVWDEWKLVHFMALVLRTAKQ